MSDQNSNDLDIFIPKMETVRVYDRLEKKLKTYEIGELVLKDRTKFIRILSDMLLETVSKYPDLQNLTNERAVQLLLEVAGERMKELYVIILKEPIEWLEENVTFANEIEIITKFVKVNDIPLLVGQIRDLIQTVKSKQL